MGALRVLRDIVVGIVCGLVLTAMLAALVVFFFRAPGLAGLLVVAFLLGLIPATIARGKGASFMAWWLFGFALFIVALPMALAMQPTNDEPRHGAAPGRAKAKKRTS